MNGCVLAALAATACLYGTTVARSCQTYAVNSRARLGLHACAGEGFDTRVSRSTGMLGSGTYFAFAAEYSICGYAREVLPAWSRLPLDGAAFAP